MIEGEGFSGPSEEVAGPAERVAPQRKEGLEGSGQGIGGGRDAPVHEDDVVAPSLGRAVRAAQQGQWNG
jgi:hypothetical protein